MYRRQLSNEKSRRTLHSLAKRLLNRSLELTLGQSLAEEALVQELLTGTNDIKEGMRAFAEKRDPQFTGT